MPPSLNHTIVWCRDKKVSAAYLTDTLGLGDRCPSVRSWSSRWTTVSHSTFTTSSPDTDIASQHYAFLVSEQEFDEIFGRIR